MNSGVKLKKSCAHNKKKQNMAKPKEEKKAKEPQKLGVESANINEINDFSQELIKQINKEYGGNIAFNLGTDSAPTDIKRWIPTGSRQLDCVLSNKLHGGYAEGRIVEIQAQPSVGKSHIGFHLAKSVQQMGGIAVYIDTENATNPENLKSLGINVSKRFVFVQNSCTEEILSIIESTITKARSMSRDVPVAVIWDSVSQSAPKDEIEGGYDKATIGLQARVLSKGMRKIASVIANQKVILFLISQQRVKIGCVSPETEVMYRFDGKESSKSVSSMFKDLGYDFNEMAINKPVDVQNVEVLSLEENKEVWKKITKIVKKQNAQEMIVRVNHLDVRQLSCSPDHKLFVRVKNSNVEMYEEVSVLFENEENFLVRTLDGWEDFSITESGQMIEIADFEVEGTHCYFSNGFLSHNTMFGDPNVTSGGMAIPYAASVRIKLNGGKPLVDKEGNTYGIEVTAKTIKNKTSKPFRECTFQIHFGKGIVEHENIFDYLREYYEKKPATLCDGVMVNVSGGGAWKIFRGADKETGEVLFEKKFYKEGFGKEVLYNKEYTKYVDAMMEDAYVIKPNEDDHQTEAEFDEESEEELRAVAQIAEESGE